MDILDVSHPWDTGDLHTGHTSFVGILITTQMAPPLECNSVSASLLNEFSSLVMWERDRVDWMLFTRPEMSSSRPQCTICICSNLSLSMPDQAEKPPKERREGRKMRAFKITKPPQAVAAWRCCFLRP
jgi:hypothetical protein